MQTQNPLQPVTQDVPMHSVCHIASKHVRAWECLRAGNSCKPTGTAAFMAGSSPLVGLQRNTPPIWSDCNTGFLPIGRTATTKTYRGLLPRTTRCQGKKTRVHSSTNATEQQTVRHRLIVAIKALPALWRHQPALQIFCAMMCQLVVSMLLWSISMKDSLCRLNRSIKMLKWCGRMRRVVSAFTT